MRLEVSTWGLHPQWGDCKKAPSESAGRLNRYVQYVPLPSLLSVAPCDSLENITFLVLESQSDDQHEAILKVQFSE